MRFGPAILVRLVLTAAIVAAAVGYYLYLINTAAEPAQRPAFREYPVVEVDTLEPTDFQVNLPSQGVIRPKVQSQLTAEVSGKVVEISPSFLDGAEFAKGDVLVKLDSRDFETQLIRAQAALAQMQTALTLAQAQTDKAREDWKRLGKGEPTDLALRIPQLRQAEADLVAAEADVAEARLNVERTRITAPYDGRVIAKEVEVGQFVSTGTLLGTIFADDIFEVRLPLRGDQLAFLPALEGGEKPVVKLSGEHGSHEQWTGWIDRTEAAVDQSTRQLFVIANVDTSEGPPLPSGTFVEAEIKGVHLDGVFVVPRSALRNGRTILEVDASSHVNFLDLDVVYSGAPDVIVARTDGQVAPGTRYSLTPLPFIGDGDQVTVKGEGKPPGGPPGGRPPLAQEGDRKKPEPGQEPKT